ncbi:MAG TPA: Rne/Rng family ribonuclease [Bryobacteraceae bacterium]|nr:Rne/Rng family ribonuclease [Bryobacteraceae bacterium]
MSKELVISANRHEIKLGILEDDQLVEIFFQRANEYSLAGSIHKGRVTRVLPGMQSAFVDLGLERDTFLYVSDFSEEGEDFDRVSVNREPARANRAPEPPEAALPPSGEPAAESAETAAASTAPERSERPERNERPAARGEEGSERGDHRGRRSRRRRNRGRGFPDSKYASEVSRPSRTPEPVAAAEAGASEPAPAPVPEAAAPAGDFSVLPGESLAKYSRTSIQPLDDAEEEEIRDLQETSVPPATETGAEIAAEAAAEMSDEAEEEPDDAPLAEDTVASTPIRLPVETAAAEEAEEEELFEEPREEVDEVLAQLTVSEIEDESAGESAETESISLESVTPLELVAEPPQSGSGPLSAQVREQGQGGRYMQRGPRRMRRKMRGAGQTESRLHEVPRAEGDAAEAGTGRPEPRSDSRTFSRPEGRTERAPAPSITELLKEGQEIIVQIAKEPLGQKGARITSHIALPGRYVVYMPTLEHTGVSRKIASDEERQRLKRILQIHHAGIPGGFIVRTAGEGKSEEDLAADMNFLFNLWLDIRQKAEKKPAPLLLHHDLDIVQRTLRDQLTEDFKAIWVDNEELYESVLRFVQRFQPALVTRVKMYTRPEPIFDAFNITAELEKALRPKVWLKSGGHIVINQTEALVAIDVNTGKYVGRSNRLEDTIVKTNTEAVKEIVRQIRLRDLGGIIVVDFIDMDERKNRQKVMQVLEDAMRADRAPYKILQFNDFGLVAITRKRVKQSLERALCMPCPHCEGAGYVKSVATIVSEILQEAGKLAGALEGKDVMLRVHPDVAKYLKSSQNKSLEEIEEVLRRPVLVKADPLLHHEKFDLV